MSFLVDHSATDCRAVWLVENKFFLKFSFNYLSDKIFQLCIDLSGLEEAQFL